MAEAAVLPGTAVPRRWWSPHSGPALLAAAPLLFLLVFFLYPVFRLMLLSVEGGTTAHFEKALTDGLYVAVLLRTLEIAAYVTVLCLVLGYPFAYFLATATPFWATIGFVFLLLPFWTSILVRTYAWMVILGRNGIINRFLLDTGLVSDPIPMLNNLAGVLVGMVHVLLPYAVFPLYSAIRRVDPGLLLAAEGLGASGWQVFRRVFFPLTLPGVLAGSSLVFILSAGFFITPALLGGGRVIMVAVLIEKQVRELLNWGFAAALSIVLLGAVLFVYFLLRRLMRSELEWS
ncbi:MAG: ABC transporter permease [Rhodospirillales bacterium]|nr:ABC transporter permease [Rhodospirillales bacterium]